MPKIIIELQLHLPQQYDYCLPWIVHELVLPKQKDVHLRRLLFSL